MWAHLVDSKADVILNGHDHLYERFAPQTAQGTPSSSSPQQFIVGTGGKSHYSKRALAANSKIVVDDQHGILIMELYQKAYKWQFQSINGKVYDSGHRRCN